MERRRKNTMYNTPFSTVYDTAVFGGGLCGIATALTLGGKGKKIIVVERRPQMGWEITSAFNCEFGKNASPMAKKIKTGLQSAGGYKKGLVSPPVAEIFFSELMEKECVEVLLYSYPLQLLTEKGLACGVIVGNKSGEQIIKARTFVDATEEAILWKQTGIKFREDTSGSYTYSVFFNGIDKGIKEFSIPRAKNNLPETEIKPSVWKNECRAEFKMETSSISCARLKVPDVISLVRKKVPQLKNAIVTHTGFELFPEEVSLHLDEKKCLRHPDIGNLFSSGIWSMPDAGERTARNSIAGRLATGEETGLALKKSFAGYRRYNPKPHEPGNTHAKSARASDVVVAGGGTAGALAAIASARNKAKTTLLEAGTMQGGIGTGGGIHIYYHGVAGGLQDEVDERVKKLSPLFCGNYSARGFHPEAKKVALEQMCAEAGVETVYCAAAVGVEMSGRRIKNVLAATPEGKLRYPGRVFIDSTGDGDVAVAAGAPYETGRKSDELPHAYSQSAGLIDIENRVLSGSNFDAGYTDPSDATDLTRARRLGLSHLRQERYTEKIRLLYIAPLIGLRQSRQVSGDYLLTLDDEICARRFADCIGYTKAHYDNHFASCFDMANQSDTAVLWTWVLGNWSRIIGCEIPYRCLLPAKVENCLVSCRAVSIDVEAHYEFRMQPDMQRIGEAAGIAAAMSARLGVKPRVLDVTLLQKRLKTTGALKRKMRPEPAIPELSSKKLQELFFSERPQDTVWIFSFSRKAVPFLKDVLKNGTGQQKFWASVALAMHREKDAVPELIRCVSERKPDITEGHRTVPFWQFSIVFLGRIGDKRAIPVLMEVLSDRTAPIDALIAAVRAIGRIGDRNSAHGLLQFLRRKDIPHVRKLQRSYGPTSRDITEDALWQVELAVAESLKKLGILHDGTIKKHLNDPRSYVRRYAKRILFMAEMKDGRTY